MRTGAELSDKRFWNYLEKILATGTLAIDRPKGSTHPRYPDFVYPLDYGYVADTVGGDGQEIDVWVGDLPGRQLVGVICTVDIKKRDTEVKLLLGCTPDDMRTILAVHNDRSNFQAGVLIERPGGCKSTGQVDTRRQID